MKRHKIKSLVPTLALGVLLVARLGGAEETAEKRSITNLKGETVIVPDAVPDREKLHSLGALTVNVESSIGKDGLILALYGGETSQRPEDAEYVELYDLAGNLLEIAWFDGTGQVKVAHDQNLTDPDAKELAKVLVMDAGYRPSVDELPARLHF